MIVLTDDTDVAVDELERVGTRPPEVETGTLTRVPATDPARAGRGVSARAAERQPPEIYLG